MGWRCLCWPISWSRVTWVPDEHAQTEIDYQTIGEDFHYGEEKGAVFGLGLWMRDLKACFQSGTYSLLKFNNSLDSLERRKWGRVCHVLEPYTRTTETHQTLWIQRNNCFSISDVYSTGVIQRGWISRLHRSMMPRDVWLQAVVGLRTLTLACYFYHFFIFSVICCVLM